MTRAPAPPTASALLPGGEARGPDPVRDREHAPHGPFPPAKGPYAEAEAEAALALFAAMLARLGRRVSLFIYRGFFEPLVPVRVDDQLLTLAAPSPFHRDWLRDHYADLLEQAATEVQGERMRVALVHDERITGPSAPMPDFAGMPEGSGIAAGSLTPAGLRAFPAGSAASDAASSSPPPSGAVPPPAPAPAPSAGGRVLPYRMKKEPQLARGVLNPRYTFETFITGHSNRMAFASCQAVAEHPASKYSPLFLFGSTGLGKTHLLHAIGNALLKTHPALRIVYMSAEEWVNE